MVCQSRLSLLFVTCMASTAFGQVVTSVTASKWDEWVKDSLQRTVPEKEYFSLEGHSCSPYCPSGWVTYGRRCFMYVAQHMNWISAEVNHCLDLGANLVSIHSEDEYQVVKALIRAHDPNENPTWIGLNNCMKKHNWLWSDGTKVTFTKWNPDEPNFKNSECCVHINFSVFMNWNDIPCVDKYPFVCVKKLN
ncbi:lactose-binding lectin l-2-like [Pangasianodon hypophthalmus]|uniref:lactose-binding lectin l-2-like n=1 Tax=Pangasianodon hypophthalmus TaxID=310915 RepID=UPI002306F2EB|nr:lactose-binding lectin l-2-like [Pangasianodon hypophthalmus]